MSNFDGENIELIDAIPGDGNLSELGVCGDCPLAFDASGTRVACFEAAALSPAVAGALYDRRKKVPAEVERQLARETGYSDPIRMGEYAQCLLARASGHCALYNPATRRARTGKEISRWLHEGEVSNV